MNDFQCASHGTAEGDVANRKSTRPRRIAIRCLCCMPRSTSTQPEHHQHPKSRSDQESLTNEAVTAPMQISQSRGGKGKEKTAHNPSTTSKEKSNNIVSNSAAISSTSASERFNRKLYKCSECRNGYTLPSNLRRHFRLKHGVSSKTEDNLISRSTSKSTTNGSATMSVRVKRIVLAESTRGAHKMHPKQVRRKKKGGSVVNRCPQCRLTLTSRRNLAIHMATHKDVRPFACRLCFWWFKRKGSLFIHLQRKHGKSEKVARTMAYRAFPKKRYNMRERCKPRASIPIKISVPPAKVGKYVPTPMSKPTPLVESREVIVIVGDIKFCTPGLMVKPPKRLVQGCSTHDEWFWENYCETVEELNCAPLIKEEPEFDLSLVEMAELLK